MYYTAVISKFNTITSLQEYFAIVDKAGDNSLDEKLYILYRVKFQVQFL